MSTLLERQTQLANFLVWGWPSLDIQPIAPVSAEAAVGNGTQENNCLPVTTGAKDHGSDGIFQWRLERLDNMKAFGIKNFGGWETIEAQAAFFLYECKGWYKPLWLDLVAGTKSLATLTANICEQYEKPAAEFAALDARIKYATEFAAVWTPGPKVVPDVPAVPVVPVVPSVPEAPVAPKPIPGGNIAVVRALAAGIMQSAFRDDILALAKAITREVE